MPSLSETSVVDIFKGLILDSLMRDGFIRKPQSSESFISRNKKYFMVGAAVVAGAVLTPMAITGMVAALGFGEAGIVAGSIAAWMMSLHRGAVAAGSLVAILQSVGAAGLGIGAAVAAGFGGGMFAGAVAKALQIILESNPEGLKELEDLVSITDENENNDTKVIFDMKYQLLNDKEKSKSFLRGFDLARQVAQERTKKFKFLVISVRENEKCLEDICEIEKCFHEQLIEKYGNDHVISEDWGYFLNLDVQ